MPAESKLGGALALWLVNQSLARLQVHLSWLERSPVCYNQAYPEFLPGFWAQASQA
jgi:hypothetical protein